MANKLRFKLFHHKKRKTQKHFEKTPSTHIPQKEQKSYTETYYFIDFENVHEEGVSNPEALSHHDHIHFFFTKNASKISIELFTSLSSADLISHEIPVGSQSLDMHLVSYLGYLIGKNTSKDCKYVIISKDTDYDNIISFWIERTHLDITRRAKITSAPEKILPKTSVIANSADQSNKPKKKTAAASSKKVQLNTEIQRALSKAKFPAATISKVASTVVKQYGNETFATNVDNELRTSFTNYSDLYNTIKPVLKKYT